MIKKMHQGNMRMPSAEILSNPALQEILAKLRDKNTGANCFRMLLRRAGYLCTYEILARDAGISKSRVETPLGSAPSTRISGHILQVAVMRAGEPFCEGGASLLDELGLSRSIGFVDAKRLEGKGNSEYFEIEIGSFKVPPFDSGTTIIIYDPMLATASTAVRIVDRISKMGKPKNMAFCSVISSEYGVKRLSSAFPQLKIYTLATDPRLNGKGYIVPGLGDAGDRAFGSY